MVKIYKRTFGVYQYYGEASSIESARKKIREKDDFGNYMIVGKNKRDYYTLK